MWVGGGEERELVFPEQTGQRHMACPSPTRATKQIREVGEREYVPEGAAWIDFDHDDHAHSKPWNRE